MLLCSQISTIKDVGASRKIIDGSIKLKSDGRISRFIRTGLLFEDGSKLDADVIMLATGYAYFVLFATNGSSTLSPRFTDTRNAILRLLPSDLHDKVQPVFGLTDEGEFINMANEIGGRGPEGHELAGLWVLIGNLASGRFHSKHLALRKCTFFLLRSWLTRSASRHQSSCGRDFWRTVLERECALRAQQLSKSIDLR